MTGRVSNEATGAYLEGATVSVRALNLRTTTSREGEFSFYRIPEGTHVIEVYYTGLMPWSKTVNVTAGAMVDLPIELKDADEIVRLEKIVVTGEREGNAASITRQRNAENVVSVISMDAYGNVADGNVGNFLQNLPGLAVNIEAGDVIGVSVRGTPPDMNSVTLDGTRSSSPTIGVMPQGDRAMLVDQIPSDSIKEIEITKGNRPDMPADSLGGSVNLVTKSAFDYRNRVIDYRAGANLNTYRSSTPVTPTAAISYMDTFFGRRLGIAFSASYTETVSHRDRVQGAYLVKGQPINSRARYLDDTNTRRRGGISANFEYRFNKTLRTWVKLAGTYYNFHTERLSFNTNATGSRRVADYNKVSRADIEAGKTPRTASNQTAGIAPGYTGTFTELLNATFTSCAAEERRYQRTFKAALGGEKKFTDGLVTTEFSYNPGRATNNYLALNATLPGIGMAIDTTDRDRPKYTQTIGPSIAYGSNFNLYKAEWIEQPDRTKDDITNYRIDAEKTLRVFNNPVKLKSGFDMRHQTRWMLNTYRPKWYYVGVDGVQGVNPDTSINDDNLSGFLKGSKSYGLFDGHYEGMDQLDFDRFRSHFKTHPEQFSENGTTVSKKAIPGESRELVNAGYIQATSSIGPLTILAGVRAEETRVKARGSLSDPYNPDQTTIERRGSYSKVFPSVHVTYNVVRNFVLRASYSTSCGRPEIKELIPYTTVTYRGGVDDDGTVVSSNPSLKPQYSKNYDLSIEYYLEPAGVISAGVFRKDITDFIATTHRIIGEGPGNGFDGRYEGFTFTTRDNMGDARIDGLELNYNQSLHFLPKPFKGLTLWANYTRLNTSGTNAAGEESPLVEFVPTTYNAGIVYKIGKLTLRATHHFKGSYYFRFSAAATAGTYKTDDPTWDFNVQYRLNSRLNFFVDYLNAFNHSPDWYVGDRSRTYVTEVYGARLNMGISGRF
ncbi:TonB-dependent receptor [Ereboglobus luteus]|nr:TonB-dependent receptor [Ereboglobus luteus]